MRTAQPPGWPIRYRLQRPLQRFEAWVGGRESREFLRQSRALSKRWTMLATPTPYREVPQANHFTVIEQLNDSDSEMVRCIVNLVENPRLRPELADPDAAQMASKLAGLSDDPSDDGRGNDEANQQIADPQEQADG